ncbi:MAG: NAD-dependent epimerase/dehydratase family protein [Solirubrobacteraceae bacterium]|jgi:dolichol-phosphate mannosyltransferase
MATTLVTGAGGFVGAALVRRLLRDGHDVTAVVRPGPTPWRLEELRDDVEVAAVELRDGEAAAAAVERRRADWIFHLAAHGAYSWQTDLEQMIRVNLAATSAVLDGFARSEGQAFVHSGSSSEYGRKNHAPAETEQLDPNSHYAITKAAATHLCRYFARTNRVRAVTLRLYSAYGPWEDPRRLIPTLVSSGLNGAYPPLADPTIARDFVYVDDVCEALLQAASRPGVASDAVINIGRGVQTTLAELVGVARTVFALGGEPQWGTMVDRSWDTDVWVADPRLAASALGWRATTALEDGLRQTGEWIAGQGELRRRYNERG